MRWKHTVALTSALACACTVSTVAQATLFGNCGCIPTISSPNGRHPHPEIAYIFWESASNPVWTNDTALGNGGGSRTQEISMLLSLVNNGQYWTKILPDNIAPPRLAPYATIFTGSVNGHNPVDGGFTSADIVTVINNALAVTPSPHLPSPQQSDDTIYLVLVPNGVRSSSTDGPPGNCKSSFDCNYPASTPGGVPYTAAFGFDYAGIAHELVEAIGTFQGLAVTNGCGGSGAQIADPCTCTTNESVNTFPAAAYWSVADGQCVMPESWGTLWEDVNGSGWMPTSGAFNLDFAPPGGLGLSA